VPVALDPARRFFDRTSSTPTTTMDAIPARTGTFTVPSSLIENLRGPGLASGVSLVWLNLTYTKARMPAKISAIAAISNQHR